MTRSISPAAPQLAIDAPRVALYRPPPARGRNAESPATSDHFKGGPMPVIYVRLVAAILLITPLLTVASVAAGPPVPVLGPATPVTSLNSQPYQDFPNWISADGRTIIFSSLRNLQGEELFTATRPDTNSDFGPATQTDFPNVNEFKRDVSSGVMSPDGLELFYDNEPVVGPTAGLRRATRPDKASPFGDGVLMSSLIKDGSIHQPSFVSPDGLRLYYWNLSGQVLVASRASPGADFGPPTSAPFVNLPYRQTVWLTPDELQVFSSYSDHLEWSWRPDFNTPFAPPVQINATGAAPVVYGNTVYFNLG